MDKLSLSELAAAIPTNWREVIEADEAGLGAIEEAIAAQDAKYGGELPIYPVPDNIFRAFHYKDIEDTRVFICGQDPYHQPGQAMGLAFSVPDGVKIPPSLRNIYKELRTDVDAVRESGDLSDWAEQGVLLLNSALTVHESAAGKHAKIWAPFTDYIIRTLNERADGVVFILWGRHAQSKGRFIDEERHLVINGVHPSPLSANRGFFGGNYFSKANEYLGNRSIDWGPGG